MTVIAEYSIDEARRLGLLDPVTQTSNDDPRINGHIEQAGPAGLVVSSAATEAKSHTAPRVRASIRNAPETNYRFAATAEACKKLRAVEKERTALGNLANPKKGKDGRVLRQAVLDPARLATLLAPLNELEDEMDIELLAAYHREVPRAIQEWVEATPGLGHNNLARILGETGHPVHARPYKLNGENLDALPEFHRTVRQWWAFTGNGDVTRQPGRNFVGDMSQAAVLAGGKPWVRTRTHVATQSFIKMTGKPDKNGRVKTRSPYRDIYEAAKADAIARGWGEQGRRVPYPANRADMHAYRITRKQLLKDLYNASKGTCC